MSSLVLELQQAATNSSTSVSELLRKALVVATKLNITAFREWLDHELNGYPNPKVPDYRVIHGDLNAFNPMRGWIPVFLGDAEGTESLSRQPVSQPVGELAELIEKGDSQLHIRLPPRLEAALHRGSNMPIPMQISVILGVLGNVETECMQIGDYGAIHNELKRLGVPQDQRNELESILDELKSANGKHKESLAKKGLDWVMKNAPAIGTLSDTIRGWFTTT